MYRLALDIGTNSLGWTCLKLREYKDRDGKTRLYPTGFLKEKDVPAGGVLIFSDGGRDPKTLNPKSVQRREHRALRRNYLSRRRRLSQLKKYLLRVPGCNRQAVECFLGHRTPTAGDPRPPGIYESRFRASYRPLESFDEFVAVLLHMAAHRQFESTALAGNEGEEEESHAEAEGKLQKQVKERIAAHNKETGENRPETLGGYLCLLQRDHKALSRAARRGAGVRQVAKLRPGTSKKKARQKDTDEEAGEELHQKVQSSDARQERPPSADRQWIRQEFKKIKSVQEAHFGRFTKEERTQIEDLVLEQRVLQPIEPGPCRFIPSEKRARAALPSVVYWRLLQTCNNLRVVSPTGEKRILSENERDKLVSKLSRHQKCKLSALRRTLKLGKGKRFQDESSAGTPREILGNPLCGLSREDLLGKHWETLSLETQDLIVSKLFLLRTQVHEKKQGLNRRQARAQADAGFADLARRPPAEGGLNLDKDRPGCEETGVPADRLENIKRFVFEKLPTAHVHVCLTVVLKTTHELKEDPGLDMTSALTRADIKVAADAAPTRVYQRLPYYGKVLESHVLPPQTGKPHCGDLASQYGRVPNVTVHVALNQLRKLVNALADRHGPPTQVVVEMNRDIARSGPERNETRTRQDKNRIQREKQLAELNKQLGKKEPACGWGQANFRYKLWKLQDEKDPYTGNTMTFTESLDASRTERDHIIPLSHGGVDMHWNMVLTSGAKNQAKGDLLPWDFFGQPKWKEIKKRLGSLDQKGKKAHKLVYVEKKEEEIARGVEGYGDYLPRRGPETAWINRLALAYLKHVCKDTWTSTGYLTSALRKVFGIRKKREDLRNHFLDAVMVGCAERRLVQKFSKWRGVQLAKDDDQRWILPHWEAPYQEIMETSESICPARPQKSFARYRSIPKQHEQASRLSPSALHKENYYAVWHAALPDKGAGRKKQELKFCELHWKRRVKPTADTDKLASCLTQRQSVIDFFKIKKLKDKHAVEELLAESLPDRTFREKLLKRLLARLEEVDVSTDVGVSADKDAKKAWMDARREACLEACRQLGVRHLQVLRSSCWEGTELPAAYVTVPRGHHAAVVKTANNERLEFSFNEKRRPQAKVISLLEAVRTESFGSASKGQVLYFRVGDYVRTKHKREDSYWFVKMLEHSSRGHGRIYLWPIHLATTNDKDFKEQKELFQETWGCASRHGWRVSAREIERQKLYPQKINILGQIKPFSGSFSWSSKS